MTGLRWTTSVAPAGLLDLTLTPADKSELRVVQALYVHDFPRLASYHSKNPLENPTHTTFSLPVLELLVKMGVPNKATGPFRDYDFSTSAGVHAIPSCQGTAEGFRAMDEAGGIVGLANAVKALGIPSGGKWRVEATGSSIGNYKPNWLSQMLGVSPPSCGEVRCVPELTSSHSGVRGGGATGFWLLEAAVTPSRPSVQRPNEGGSQLAVWPRTQNRLPHSGLQ